MDRQQLVGTKHLASFLLGFDATENFNDPFAWINGFVAMPEGTQPELGYQHLVEVTGTTRNSELLLVRILKRINPPTPLAWLDAIVSQLQDGDPSWVVNHLKYHLEDSSRILDTIIRDYPDRAQELSRGTLFLTYHSQGIGDIIVANTHYLTPCASKKPIV